jgi:hypothetical protein
VEKVKAKGTIFICVLVELFSQWFGMGELDEKQALSHAHAPPKIVRLVSVNQLFKTIGLPSIL